MKGFVIKSEKLDHNFKLYHVKHWEKDSLIYRFLIRQSDKQYTFDIISNILLPNRVVNDIGYMITNIYLEVFQFAPKLEIVNVTDRPQNITLLDANGIITPENAWELYRNEYLQIMISGISPNDIPINFLFLLRDKIRSGIINK